MSTLSDQAVVDASVAVKWLIPEIDSDLAAALARYRLLAPDLLDAECANVLWIKVRQNEISEADALTRIARLKAAPVERVPGREIAAAALKLSIDLRHSAYDSLYLALAIRSSVPLVTADTRFLAAVKAHPYLGSHIMELAMVPSR